MSNENQETIVDIVADIRAQNQGLPEDSYALSPLVCDLLSFADRIEAAAKREREAGAEAAQICGKIGELIGREAACKEVTDCNNLGNAAKMRNALKETQSVIAKCMEILNRIPDGVEYDGLIDEVADELCDLRDSHVKPALSAPPRNFDVDTAAHKREIAELRECLKEAIREKCPFTRMSCKHGEPCEYACGTDKWRKALEGAKDESK